MAAHAANGNDLIGHLYEGHGSVAGRLLTVLGAMDTFEAHLACPDKGELCKLVVVSKQGQQVEADSWVVSAKGERRDIGIDGATLVEYKDLAAVEVVTMDGRTLVSAFM